jgi:hypothetical protein
LAALAMVFCAAGREERAKTIEEGLRNRINLFAVI